MKKILLYSTIASFSIVNAQAAVTVTDALVRGHQDSAGANITTAGVLALLVVDAGNDGFGTVIEGTSIAMNSQIGDGNDIIINIVGSKAANPPFGPAEISGVGTGLAPFPLTNGMSAGDKFAVFWFPTLNTSTSTFSAGDTYGIARETNWELPADGNSTVSPSLVTNAGSANLTVAASAVPEPTSVALLGLGSAAMLLRRRRK